MALNSLKKFIWEKIFLLGEPKAGILLSQKAQEAEFLGLRTKIIENTKIRLAIMMSYLIGVPVFKFVFRADFNFGIIESLIAWMVFYTLLSIYLVKKNVFNAFQSLNKFYFSFLAIDLVWLTAIFHYFGGLTWISIIFYTYYIIYGFLVFPKFSYTTSLFLIICGLIVTASLLEYTGVISHQPFFTLTPALYQNSNYVGATLIAAVIALYFVAYWSYVSARILRSEKEKLQEASQSLEVRVGARTKELKELTQNLEEKVKQRTTALQEGMKELERFNRMAIGRELRMIELKQEIKGLKEGGLKKSKVEKKNNKIIIDH